MAQKHEHDRHRPEPVQLRVKARWALNRCTTACRWSFEGEYGHQPILFCYRPRMLPATEIRLMEKQRVHYRLFC
jgi:hypothetical protein